MQPSDAAVVRRVLEGEVDAFSILVDRYYDRYARFAVHMVGDAEDAEDALQEAWVRAFRSLARYEDRERFGAWFFRILVNCCRTTAARRRQRGLRFPRYDETGAAGADEQPVERDALHDLALREELQHVLARLSAEHREAFLLKYVEELDYETMSEMTGAGVSALKMRVKRACDRLRQLLKEGSHV